MLLSDSGVKGADCESSERPKAKAYDKIIYSTTAEI
jgi:hypothetical protein